MFAAWLLVFVPENRCLCMFVGLWVLVTAWAVKLGIVTERGAHGSRDSAFCWVWGGVGLDWMSPYGPPRSEYWAHPQSREKWSIISGTAFLWLAFPPSSLYSHGPINSGPKPPPENQPELDEPWHLNLISTSWLRDLVWFLSPLINELLIVFSRMHSIVLHALGPFDRRQFQ